MSPADSPGPAPPSIAGSRATGSTIDEQMADHIRAELAKPEDSANAETQQTRQHWRYLLARNEQKQADKARNEIGVNAAVGHGDGHGNGNGGGGSGSGGGGGNNQRDNGPSSSVGLSSRRFDGSILDMDGLSNLDLNTADQATRRRVIETCNQHADYFRAQLDGRRPRERISHLLLFRTRATLA
ncbi:hypothetical protein LY76DRAFT_640337 [Colletotrichum caudatum]|nr:hypothetical protein LY76DRAFT_640337 [Colletotrichum caudatum]